VAFEFPGFKSGRLQHMEMLKKEVQ